MIRDVDLVSYLPEFMQSYIEPVAALEGENPEFDIMWKEVDRVLCNRFITTADKYGISRFEKILGIRPQSSDSLEMRKIRVQNRWFNNIPYTIRVLFLKLSECLGGVYNFDIYTNFQDAYKLTIIIYSTDDSRADEVEYLLSVIVPVDIVIEVIYESVTTKGYIFFDAIMEQADIIELKQR